MISGRSFSHKKNIKANVKEQITKLYKAENYIFPRKYCIKKDIDQYKLLIYIIAQISGGLFALAFYNSVKNNNPNLK